MCVFQVSLVSQNWGLPLPSVVPSLLSPPTPPSPLPPTRVEVLRRRNERKTEKREKEKRNDKKSRKKPRYNASRNGGSSPMRRWTLSDVSPVARGYVVSLSTQHRRTRMRRGAPRLREPAEALRTTAISAWYTLREVSTKYVTRRKETWLGERISYTILFSLQGPQGPQGPLLLPRFLSHPHGALILHGFSRASVAFVPVQCVFCFRELTFA